MWLKSLIFFIILLSLGFGFRYLISAGNTDMWWSDDYGYHVIAKQVLEGKNVASCCSKSYGYSYFLAPIYYFFGDSNEKALWYIQIFLDLISALLVYFTARGIFNRKTALYAFVIYLSNPFTSAFTSLHMAEILTFFLVMLIAFLLSRKSINTNRLLWISWGFILGLLVFVRFQSVNMSYVLLLIIGVLCLPKSLKLKFIIFSVIGFLLSSSVMLYSNYVKFHKIALGPPYSVVWSILYEDYYFNTRFPPELNVDTQAWATLNPKIISVYGDFTKCADDLNCWTQVENKYKMMFIRDFPQKWISFVNNYFMHIIWIWDKYHISHFLDIYYPDDIIPLRIYNILLLVLFLFGLISHFIKKRLAVFCHPLSLYMWVFFFYVLFIYPLVSTETRHSLNFYPLLMIWAGYGLERILFFIKSIFPKKKIVE